MAYIEPGDYAAYGLTGIDPAQVEAAGRVVNAYVRRPEGLVWLPDFTGAPAYMAGADPSYTLNTPAGLSAGTNITLDCPNAGQQYLGEAVVIDRATPAKTEVCVVTAVSGNTLTLAQVKLAHPAGCSVEFGLTLTHEADLPEKRSAARLGNTPVARLLSGLGKYSPARRSAANTGGNPNILGALSAFGGPTPWVPFDITQADLSPATGEVWVPPGLLLAYFTRVRIRYVAGYPKGGVPGAVLQAVANVALSSIDSPFGGNLKVHKQGDATLERFAASALDADTMQLLNAYRGVLLG